MLLWGSHGQLNRPNAGKTLQREKKENVSLCPLCLAACVWNFLRRVFTTSRTVCVARFYPREEYASVCVCVCFAFLSEKLLNTWSDSSLTLLSFFIHLETQNIYFLII